MCSNCGRLLVGPGDFCPYCGFPRPKLTEQLEDTGAVPRVRPPKRNVDWAGLGKRLGIAAGVIAVAIAIIIGVSTLLNRTSATDSTVAERGTIPEQVSPPDASWSIPSADLFSGLGKIKSLRFYEPGRYDEEYASNLVVTASNASGQSQLVSMNAFDGSVRWRINAATPFECSDHPISGSIACLYDSQLRVLVLDDGVIARTLPVHVTSQKIAVIGETVLAISGRKINDTDTRINVQAFSQDATLQWSSEQVVTGATFGLSTSGGLVAVTGVRRADDGSPVVLRASGGERIELPEGSAKLLNDDTIAVTKDAKTSICSDSGSCNDPVEGTPVIPSVYDSDVGDFPNMMLVEGDDGRELRVYESNGDVAWKREVSDPTTVGFCAQHVIVRDKASLRALAPDDGSEAWSADAIPESVAIWCDPERVMTFTADTTMTAFVIEDGNDDWTLELTSRPTIRATTAGLVATGTTWIRYA